MISTTVIRLAGACSVDVTERNSMSRPPEEGRVVTSAVPPASRPAPAQEACDRVCGPSAARTDRFSALEALAVPDFHRAVEPPDRENYAHCTGNPHQRVAAQPCSTFGVEVDTGACSMPDAGRKPVRDAICNGELAT